MPFTIQTGHSRLVFNILVAAAGLTAAAIVPRTSLAQGTGNSSDKPNFVLILADDLGYNDVGCYGSPLIKTPNIDELAKEGIKFTSFYMAPTCTPSRAALLTGCYPQRVGIGDQLSEGSPARVLHPGSPYGLNPKENNVAKVLKTAGYSTALIGKWHIGDAPEFNPIHEGFDYFYGTLGVNNLKPVYLSRGMDIIQNPADQSQFAQEYTSESLAYIKAHKDKPFFLYLSHNYPHVPLSCSAAFKGKSPRGPYGDAVMEVDWSVGQVMKCLKENGLDKKTIVIFTSDNGPYLTHGESGGSATPFRNGKCTTYDGGMRVPFIARWPGHIPEGTTCTEIATGMDFLPTFAALAGADVPTTPPIDGKNIVDLITGKPGAKTPYDHLYYYFGNELHAVRSGPWKFHAKDNLESEDVYRKPSVADVPMPESLYNLDSDPGEQKSVLKDHPKIVKHMRELMDQARADLGDSLTNVPPTNARPPGFSQHPVKIPPGELNLGK